VTSNVIGFRDMQCGAQ